MRPVGRRLRIVPVMTMALLTGAAAPAGAIGGLVTVLDNSYADSILEVDRAANLQYLSNGTVGSDHDGSAVDAIQALLGERDSDDDD